MKFSHSIFKIFPWLNFSLIFFSKYFFIAYYKPGSLLGAGSKMIKGTDFVLGKQDVLLVRETKWVRDYSTALLML